MYFSRSVPCLQNVKNFSWFFDLGAITIHCKKALSSQLEVIASWWPRSCKFYFEAGETKPYHFFLNYLLKLLMKPKKNLKWRVSVSNIVFIAMVFTSIKSLGAQWVLLLKRMILTLKVDSLVCATPHPSQLLDILTSQKTNVPLLHTMLNKLMDNILFFCCCENRKFSHQNSI